MRIRFARNGPAISEHVGIEQIRGRRSRPVVKGGAEDAIGQFQWRGSPRPDRLEPAGPRLGNERVFGNAHGFRHRRRRPRGRAALDDRLGENRETHDGVGDHQRGQRQLRTQRRASQVENPVRPDVGEIGGGDVAEDDRAHCGIPGEPRADHADVDAISGGPEEIPTVSERIGRERHYVLSLGEQIRKVMRQVIGNGDRDQGEGEALCHFQRRTAWRQHAHDGAHGEIGAEKHSPERHEPDRPGDERVQLAGARQQGNHLTLEFGPFRRGQQPVVENRRQHEQDEGDHRGRCPLVDQQTGAEGPQRQSASAGKVPDARFGRGEAGKYAEENAEHLAALDPGLHTEHGHAGPSEQRIKHGKPSDVGGHGGARKHEFGPGKDEQQRDGGPDSKRLGIRPAQDEIAAGDGSVESVDRFENGLPWIDQRPEIPDEGGENREPDPPDDPHQRRCDVLIGILASAEPGDNGQDEEADGDEFEKTQDNRMRDKSAQRVCREIDARIAPRAGCRAHQQADDDEGRGDGGRCAQ